MAINYANRKSILKYFWYVYVQKMFFVHIRIYFTEAFGKVKNDPLGNGIFSIFLFTGEIIAKNVRFVE